MTANQTVSAIFKPNFYIDGKKLFRIAKQNIIIPLEYGSISYVTKNTKSNKKNPFNINKKEMC